MNREEYQRLNHSHKRLSSSHKESLRDRINDLRDQHRQNQRNTDYFQQGYEKARQEQESRNEQSQPFYGGPDNPGSSADNGYQWPRPHKRHWLMTIVVIAVVLIGGIAWLGHSSDQASTQPKQPQTVKKTVINNNHQPDRQGNPNDYASNGKLRHLQAEANQIGLTQQEQQKALQFYQRQDASQQKHLYDLSQRLDRLVPSNTIKRAAVEHYLDNAK